jgi:hypothetical protein
MELIRCINCDQFFLRTPFDQWPEYEVSHSPGSFVTVERDDFNDFRRTHHGHRLESLKIIEDSYISEKSYAEPKKVSYFKATNGKERFVIKRFRMSIDNPLTYQLIRGDYSLKCIRLEIQSNEIKKQLQAEFREKPFPEHKIAAFIDLYQRIAEGLSIDQLERVPEESPLPLEIFYIMDEVSLAYLLRNCRTLFKGQEYLDIEAFIRRHKDDGVLLLKGSFRIEITEAVKAKGEDLPVSLPSEQVKVAEKK